MGATRPPPIQDIMKTYTYIEPGPDLEPIHTTMTEAQIIRTYYPYWCQQMRKVNKAHLINYKNCIEDWICVHWAWEVKNG